MKRFVSFYWAVGLSLYASLCLGAITHATDISALGGRFVPTPGLIRCTVPDVAFAELPPQINQWARAAQTPLPLSAVAWVVD